MKRALALTTILALPGFGVAAPPTIALDPLSPEASAAALKDASVASGGALRLGFGRTIPASSSAVTAVSEWHTTTTGEHTRRLRIVSPGAAGVRLALRIEGIPDTATLRFSTRDVDHVHVLDGATVKASLRADRKAGTTAPRFWSPTIDGDTLLLTVTLPVGTDPRRVRLDLTKLSHLVRLPGVPRPGPEHTSRASKATDPACAPALERQSRASALLLYTDPGGATGSCSGVLVNSTHGDPAPTLMLTAHHCVHTQDRASSLESYWLLYAHTCGGSVPAGAHLTGGADLIDTDTSTDTAVL